jgi:hypothetical protein
MATVTPNCVVTEYRLTLNSEEASVLLSVLNMIGGDYKVYPRRVTENIGEALKSAGVSSAELACEPGRDGIYFK